MTERPLSPTELAVLAAVHRADEEEGGLSLEELEGDDERDALGALLDRGLVETIGDDEGEEPFARITALGVSTLRDLGFLR